MDKMKMVLASAFLALAMVLSMMTLPAIAGNDSSAGETADDPALEADVLTEETTDPYAFTMVSIGEPNYLDPAVDYETSGGEVIENVYETLVWYDGASAIDLKPVLATEVPTIENGLVSADGMNYTFNIRGGVTFHDGTELTAEDVEYSVERVLRIHDPSGPSWMIEQVMTDFLSFYIDGYTTVDDWATYEGVPQWLIDGAGLTETDILSEADNQAVAEFMVTQVDSDTVNFRLTKPYPAFIKICAYTVMSVVSMDYVEANGGIVNGQHNPVMDQTTCGTGPYEMESWVRGSQIHLTRNAGYWGQMPALADVYLVTATDEATRISMLENGTADSIKLSILSEDIFLGDPDYEITKGLPTFDMTFAGFNMNIDESEAATYGSDVPSDFFTDSKVRSAFVHMINYEVFIQNVLKGNAMESNGPIPMGMFGYDGSVPAYDYDLLEAKAFLQAAVNPRTGNSWWEDGFSIALFYNAGNIYRETACLYIQNALDDLTAMAAGDTGAVFACVVNTLDWPTYLAMIRSSPSAFPLFYLGWGPDYADPDDYCTPFLDSAYGTFTSITSYENETVDSLVRDAAVELDEDLRAQMYSELTWTVRADAPYIWLWQACNFHIERSWVDGYYFNPMHSGLYYAALSKDGGEPPAPPVADFVFTPEWPAAGVLVTFSAEGSYDAVGIATYSWSFDDGTFAEGYEVSHAFDSAGRYTVTLTVTNLFGLEASASQTVKVTGHSPSIYGTVVGPDMAPLSGATVRLYCDGALVTKATTDIDGSFVFYTLEPGDYKISVSVPGLGSASVYVSYTGDPVCVGEIVL